MDKMSNPSVEEQKRVKSEKKEEAKALIKTLEAIVNAKRKQIEQNSYSKSIPLARFYDQEKLSFLEPIANLLKNIEGRLDALEN
jgi:ribosome-binding factor A